MSERRGRSEFDEREKEEAGDESQPQVKVIHPNLS
jgi:hypothetical protein